MNSNDWRRAGGGWAALTVAGVRFRLFPRLGQIHIDGDKRDVPTNERDAVTAWALAVFREHGVSCEALSVRDKLWGDTRGQTD